MTFIQDTCTKLEQHCISVAATLEKCVQAKEGIVHYYDHIREQLKADDELCKVQEVQLRNKEEHWRQYGGSHAVHTNTVFPIL
jgi:hypothetical protein